MDIFLLADEYEHKIKKRFLGDKTVFLWGHHGLINDSFEMRTWAYPCKFTFDMMLVYNYNQTHQTNGESKLEPPNNGTPFLKRHIFQSRIS
jgi:hypothetical protein